MRRPNQSQTLRREIVQQFETEAANRNSQLAEPSHAERIRTSSRSLWVAPCRRSAASIRDFPLDLLCLSRSTIKAGITQIAILGSGSAFETYGYDAGGQSCAPDQYK
jgi:hypothetical protein